MIGIRGAFSVRKYPTQLVALGFEDCAPTCTCKARRHIHVLYVHNVRRFHRACAAYASFGGFGLPPTVWAYYTHVTHLQAPE
jgi:hypothetical protein